MHARIIQFASSAAATLLVATWGASACSTAASEADSAANRSGSADASTEGAASTTGDAGQWNNQYTVPHIDAGPIPDFIDFSKIPDPWPSDDEASCIAAGTEYPESRKCLCAGCLELMHQCDALPGCIEIRSCIWKSGCTDPNTCYILNSSGNPTGCVDVIDKWGNTGDDVAIATAALQCGQKLVPACPQPAK